MRGLHNKTLERDRAKPSRFRKSAVFEALALFASSRFSLSGCRRLVVLRQSASTAHLAPRWKVLFLGDVEYF